MKQLAFFAIFMMIISHVLGQADTIKFKQFGDSSEFSTLDLHPNKTFAYHHYNTRSCFTWYHVFGTWKIDNDRILFEDSVSWREEIITVDTFVTNADYVLFTVKNNYGKPLPGIEIEYGQRSVNEKNTNITDKNGQIKIRKNVLARRQEHYPYERFFSISFSNKKSNRCSMSTSFDTIYNKFDITIVDDPKEENYIRTTTYRINNNEIYFVDQTCTGDKEFYQKNWGNFREKKQLIP